LNNKKEDEDVDLEGYFKKIWLFFTEESMDAFNNREIEKWFQYLSDNIILRDFSNLRGQRDPNNPLILNGIEQVREWVASIFQDLNGVVEYQNMTRGDGYTFDLDYAFKGVYKGTTEIKAPLKMKFKVEGLKVVEVDLVLNPSDEI
jgi:hypothetical protein